MSPRTLLPAALLASLSMLAASSLGCAARSGAHTLVAVDDNGGLSPQSVSGDVAVGSTLTATANVNLRTGPSRSNDVIDVVPSGDTATLVESSPTNGYYHLNWNGEDGWSKGTYWQVTGAPSSGGGSSGGGTTTPPSPPPASGGAPWTCSGSYAKTPVDTGDYYLTEFGCWVDTAGNAHGDPGDNCIPGCLSQAISAGLCNSGDTGKTCEQNVNWFIADAGRFGCLQRVRVRNPANGKSVIAVALDYGPACWVERSVSHGVIDASGAVNRALFGSDMGVSDKAPITVELVDNGTTLGPE